MLICYYSLSAKDDDREARLKFVGREKGGREIGKWVHTIWKHDLVGIEQVIGLILSSYRLSESALWR